MPLARCVWNHYGQHTLEKVFFMVLFVVFGTMGCLNPFVREHRDHGTTVPVKVVPSCFAVGGVLLHDYGYMIDA